MAGGRRGRDGFRPAKVHGTILKGKVASAGNNARLLPARPGGFKPDVLWPNAPKPAFLIEAVCGTVRDRMQEPGVPYHSGEVME